MSFRVVRILLFLVVVGLSVGAVRAALRCQYAPRSVWRPRPPLPSYPLFWKTVPYGPKMTFLF